MCECGTVCLCVCECVTVCLIVSILHSYDILCVVNSICFTFYKCPSLELGM